MANSTLTSQHGAPDDPGVEAAMASDSSLQGSAFITQLAVGLVLSTSTAPRAHFICFRQWRSQWKRPEQLAPPQENLAAAIQSRTTAAQASVNGEAIPEIPAHLWPNGNVPPLPPLGAPNDTAEFSNMFQTLMQWIGILSSSATATMPMPIFLNSMAIGFGPMATIHHRRPRFDAVAFVGTLDQVDLADIAAEDMRCPHCWLPFGTEDEEEPSFLYSPDPDAKPELAARQVTFRELPFCAGRADKDTVRTPCKHLFGRGCLIDTMENVDTFCPTCRQDLMD